MGLEDLGNYVKFTRQEKLDLLLTLLLPLASGVVILIAVNPSLVTEAGVLSLCLLAVVTILPALADERCSLVHTYRQADSQDCKTGCVLGTLSRRR